jgi:acyl-CoA thioesterase
MSHETPQALAERAAATMWASDRASQALAMEILAVGPGTARLAMTVTEAMTNGHQTAHGGYIFTLADSAFAFACNSTGETTVAAQCSITYIAPGKLGDRLVASARQISRRGRSGIYDVQVAVDGQVVAEFRGHSRSLGTSFLTPQAV